MKTAKLLTLLALLFMLPLNARERFNKEWQFSIGDKFDSTSSVSVELPHTANLEPLIVNNQWQGICWYHKVFEIGNYSPDNCYFIEFEAAMNHTTIWINSQMVKIAEGGYLPIVVDATPYLTAGENVIELRLDNNDNERTGPKPLKILDFNMYGGLYRNAWFTTKRKIHITNPTLANRAASGGVFVTYPKVSTESSEIMIQSHIANREDMSRNIQLTYRIYDGEKLLLQSTSDIKSAVAHASLEFRDVVTLDTPKLWSPTTPNLYNLEVEVASGDEVMDCERVRFGIREFKFKDNQLYINGVKSYLRGVNRHQEYPYIGYALSDNAQYRDAKRIKDGGFDYVRLSHYPQSPAFMAACDELGLVVADAILGWQFYRESDDFKNHAYESARQLIRRDRNHPCVLAWEVSLNETKMPVPFMQILHDIVHEEYPGENTYSCGWMSDVYDIFFQARQHRLLHKDMMTFDKPYMVSEYGDWEYYSKNAGLNQHQHSIEKRIEMSSRQLRSSGEVRLQQQAHNLQESHNDNMNIPATGDSYWVMFDYNRGYHNDLEASGVMDIFRLPKYGYYFYQSQQSAKPMVKIASYWDEKSPTKIKIYSNCDKVSLLLNNRPIATQTPDTDDISNNLTHPPFTFEIGKFERGTIKAVGYIDNKEVVTDIVRTPERVKSLKIWIDESGRKAESGCKDAIFLYIAAVDKNGTICHDFTSPITLETDSKVSVLNTDGIVTEAGIATALIGIGNESGETRISATSESGLKGTYKLKIE